MSTAQHPVVEENGVPTQWDLLTRQLPAIVWSTDDEFHLTSLVGAGLGLLEMASADVIGQNVCEVFGARGAQGELAVVHERALRGEVVDCEQNWNGHVFHVHVEALRDSSGEILGCAGVALVVTGWRRAESALEQEETRLQALISNVPGAVYRCSDGPARTIEFISDAVESITGYRASDFILNRRCSFLSIIDAEDWPRVERQVADAIENKTSFDVEYRIRRSDGQVRWVQDRGQVIHDEEGRVRWIDGVVLDVTQRKQVEASLPETNRTIEARIAERSAAVEARALDPARSPETLHRQTQIQQYALNSIDDGVLVVDENGQFLLFTALVERILGKNAAPVLPEKWVETYGIYREDMVTPFPFDQLPLVRAMRGEECPGTVVFVRNPRVPEGLFLKVVARPWRDDHGVVRGGVAVLRNITVQHRARETLRATEAWLALLMDQVPIIMWTTDRNLVITSSLGAGLKEVGLQLGQVVGMTLHEYLQQRDETHALIRAHRQALEGIPSTFESRHENLVFSTHIEPFYDADRRIIGTIGLGQNITERKRSEEALRESEAKFRILAETVTASTFIFQGERMLYVNPAAVSITGYSREELLAMDFWEVIHPEHQEMVRQRGMARQGGEPVSPSYEVQIRRKDGVTRWVNFTAGIIDFQGSKAVLGTAFDITELKQAEQALRLSEAKNKAILDAMPDLVFRLSRNGTYLDVKAGNVEDLVIPPGELIGKHVRDVLSPEMVPLCLQTFEKALQTREVQSFEYRLTIQGRERDFEARVMASGDNELVVVVRDMTEHRRLEREILDISDREQRRIGQDLHDGLCQHLTGTAFTAKILEQKLAERNLTEAADAREIAELLEQAISQARRLARGLYPTEIEGEGIVPALDHLATTLSDRFNIRCTFERRCDLPSLERTQAFHLYRIAQEATNNAIRHGQARIIRIGLASKNGTVRLSVHDDGVGFVPPTTKFQGMGLHIMKYRAQMLGGSFDIQRRKSGGTEVVCTFTCDRTNKRNGGSHGNKKKTRSQNDQATGVRGR